jgi:DDE superfamily endonuclease
LKPHTKQYWCIPPQQSGEFVAGMEDVLELYQQPYDPMRPVVCMDETSKQLVGETRTPVASSPGKPRRIDYEYERRGTADVFLFTEPLGNCRWAEITERRTRLDWALQIRDLVDVFYPEAKTIRLVMDNLNTHTIGSLYEAFPAAEARRIAEKLELHYTPKHGSWLNMAEIELRVLTVQCLNRRIPDATILRREVHAWETDRNASNAHVDWQFTSDDARIHLKQLYPRIQS